MCRKIFSDDGMKVVVKSKKGEKLQKHNIQLGDGAKYMSYIKVVSFMPMFFLLDIMVFVFTGALIIDFELCL